MLVVVDAIDGAWGPDEAAAHEMSIVLFLKGRKRPANSPSELQH
ncbi:Hypothetical protein (plasmid) [Pseudomonas putida]|nr:Hypothetical protein [Pseudomonas putida]